MAAEYQGSSSGPGAGFEPPSRPRLRLKGKHLPIPGAGDQTVCQTTRGLRGGSQAERVLCRPGGLGSVPSTVPLITGHRPERFPSTARCSPERENAKKPRGSGPPPAEALGVDATGPDPRGGTCSPHLWSGGVFLRDVPLAQEVAGTRVTPSAEDVSPSAAFSETLWVSARGCAC